MRERVDLDDLGDDVIVGVWNDVIMMSCIWSRGRGRSSGGGGGDLVLR